MEVRRTPGGSSIHGSGIAHFGFVEPCLWREVVDVAARQILEDRDLVTTLEQQAHDFEPIKPAPPVTSALTPDLQRRSACRAPLMAACRSLGVAGS